MIRVDKTELDNGNHRLNFIYQPKQIFRTYLNYNPDFNGWIKKWYFKPQKEEHYKILPQNAHFNALEEKTNNIGITFKLGPKVKSEKDKTYALDLGKIIFFENKGQDLLFAPIHPIHIVKEVATKSKPRQVAPKIFYDEDAEEEKLKASLNEEVGEGYYFHP
jgi:hypothetical protein